ncbi:hypothetical protein H6F89_00450 [Cyanobacteria bacterium FACHB-63]|nr:hypothetical protein [Cyanobacteria bacterium FACHB-63]
MGANESVDSKNAAILKLHGSMSTVIKAKRKALGLAALWILTSFILSFSIAQVVNRFLIIPSSVKIGIRLLSLLILAFSTFSRLGEIATFDGNSLPERTNVLLFKLLFVFGFFLQLTMLFLKEE